MEKNTQNDVVIVSCFGRGNWLAAELAKRDLNITLVDVSESIGRWTPEDWEGPFGFYNTPKLDSSQIERLLEEDYTDAVDSGFCVWLKDGPYDLRGAHSSHLLDSLSLDPSTIDYLKSTSVENAGTVEELKNKCHQLPFDGNWLAQLGHSVAANVCLSNVDAMSYSKSLPIFETLSVRRVSRRGAEKSLNWVEDSGVKVFNKATVNDLELIQGKFSSIEIKSEHSGIIKGDNLVWMLTSEETEMCSEKVRKTLYPKGVLEPEWVWLRFRMRFQSELELSYLPIQFLMIEDIHLPWTHHNFCMVQKTVNENDYDVWMRVPHKQRFHRDYLRGTSDKVISIFEQRIPGLNVQCLEMPQDFKYDFNELGPVRFPLFSQNELGSKKPAKISNIFFEQPEVWSRLDWTGQFESQLKTYNTILNSKYKLKGVRV